MLDLPAQADILTHGSPRQESVALRNETDGKPRGIDSRPRYPNAALIAFDEPCENLQKRRFPAAL